MATAPTFSSRLWKHPSHGVSFLTGNLRPSPLIIGLAEERGIPIILTGHDTLKAIEIVDSFFGKAHFHQRKKVDFFERLLEKHMDFNALGKALGLATKT